MTKWIDERGISHEVNSGSVWTTPNGQTVKTFRHNTSNPSTGHGGSEEYMIRCVGEDSHRWGE